MKVIIFSIVTALAGALSIKRQESGLFLSQLNNQTWVIGNELWNLTQGPKYGTQLFYKDHDCVGDAVGHYVSYSE